jgi:hypothetical protein
VSSISIGSESAFLASRIVIGQLVLFHTACVARGFGGTFRIGANGIFDLSHGQMTHTQEDHDQERLGRWMCGSIGAWVEVDVNRRLKF